MSATALGKRVPDEQTLLARANLLAGRTVAEVARDTGIALSELLRRRKGGLGELAETYLGASAGNRDLPDFPELGIELKTVPIDSRGHVAESTFVATLDLDGLGTRGWESSRPWRKLRRVLWLPVEAAREAPFEQRRFGRPVIWSPSARQQSQLRADWELIVGRIAAGEIEELDALVGELMQLRPKAASSRCSAVFPGSEGETILSVPRGFYLRAHFTQELLVAAQR